MRHSASSAVLSLCENRCRVTSSSFCALDAACESLVTSPGARSRTMVKPWETDLSVYADEAALLAGLRRKGPRGLHLPSQALRPPPLPAGAAPDGRSGRGGRRAAGRVHPGLRPHRRLRGAKRSGHVAASDRPQRRLGPPAPEVARHRTRSQRTTCLRARCRRSWSIGRKGQAMRCWHESAERSLSGPSLPSPTACARRSCSATSRG